MTLLFPFQFQLLFLVVVVLVLSPFFRVISSSSHVTNEKRGGERERGMEGKQDWMMRLWHPYILLKYMGIQVQLCIRFWETVQSFHSIFSPTRLPMRMWMWMLKFRVRLMYFEKERIQHIFLTLFQTLKSLLCNSLVMSTFPAMTRTKRTKEPVESAALPCVYLLEWKANFYIFLY